MVIQKYEFMNIILCLTLDLFIFFINSVRLKK